MTDTSAVTANSPVTKEQRFGRRAKVVAVEDLPFVPAGTVGRVLYVTGVTWIRYHVLFDNGESISSLDATQLMALDEWQQQQYERRQAERRAAREAAIAARSGGTT
jgi:hypothetical protein